MKQPKTRNTSSLHYIYKMLLVLLVSLLVPIANAKTEAAKRSISEFCGPSPVDCGNGWCCIAAMKCIPGDPPTCEDLLIPSFTIDAAPYSDLDPARLTSVGLTISTFPSTTLTATNALPTYSHSQTDTTSLLLTPPKASALVSSTASRAGAASPTAFPVSIIGEIFSVYRACGGFRT